MSGRYGKIQVSPVTYNERERSVLLGQTETGTVSPYNVITIISRELSDHSQKEYTPITAHLDSDQRKQMSKGGMSVEKIILFAARTPFKKDSEFAEQVAVKQLAEEIFQSTSHFINSIGNESFDPNSRQTKHIKDESLKQAKEQVPQLINNVLRNDNTRQQVASHQRFQEINHQQNEASRATSDKIDMNKATGADIRFD